MESGFQDIRKRGLSSIGLAFMTVFGSSGEQLALLCFSYKIPPGSLGLHFIN